MQNPNLIFFYLYRICSRSYFHLPVLFVYFYIQEISILKIELLLAIYGAMLIFTGKWNALFAKIMSPKSMIACGELIKALGLTCFIFTTNIWILIIGQILSGIGYGVTAGTDASLLREIFNNKRTDAYKKVEATSNSYMFISFLLSGIIGSMIFNYNHQGVFYFSIFANIVSIISILLVPNHQEYRNSQNANVSEPVTPLQINKEKPSPSNLFWKNYYALSRAFSQAIFVGFLPYLFFIQTTVNFYFFGIVLSLFTLGGFISARFIIKLSKTFGTNVVSTLTIILSIISISLFSISESSIVNILAISLLGISNGGVRPLTLSNLDTSNMDSKQRSSFFSSMEKQYGILNMFILILGGLLFTILEFRMIMLIFATIYTIGFIWIAISKTLNMKQHHKKDVKQVQI